MQQQPTCQCGCGEPVRVAPVTDRSKGWVRGEPLRYRLGHNTRGRRRPKGPDPIVTTDAGHDTPCWLWQGGLSHGYAPRAAHRRYYEAMHGPIPVGLHLDHLCRNPACVNPDHLEPVTNAENCRRGARAILTHEKVAEMRRRRAAGELVDVLAADFGVHKNTAYAALAGESWV